jgi:hemolysin III
MGCVWPEEIKPLLRGRIHQAAFFLHIPLSAWLVYHAKSGIPKIAVALYLLTLLNMYGISSVLHVVDWKRYSLEARVQRIDHASIFLLISGTYTPMCLCCLPQESWVVAMLFSAWMIAIAGVIKCLLWTTAPRAFNVLFYFICGLTIVPFMPRIIEHVSTRDVIFMGLGGAQYLIGGFIYGIQYPDPSPSTFGYHEIFHILTISANCCFLVPMSKGFL